MSVRFPRPIGFRSFGLDCREGDVCVAVANFRTTSTSATSIALGRTVASGAAVTSQLIFYERSNALRGPLLVWPIRAGPQEASREINKVSVFSIH
jgi:hypothetical protein